MPKRSHLALASLLAATLSTACGGPGATATTGTTGTGAHPGTGGASPATTSTSATGTGGGICEGSDAGMPPPPGGPFTPGQFEYDFWQPTAPAPLWDTMDATITVNAISSLDQDIFFTIDAWFADNADPFYMGLQPHGSLPGGGLGKMALFSFFGAGASSTHPNCFQGADAGAGVSCHVAYPWSVGVTYLFEIKLTGQDLTTETWDGTVTDQTTGIKTEIGWWSIPLSHGLVGNNPLNFTEYYAPVPSCAAVGTGSVTYGAPVGRNQGTTAPTTFQATQVGVCGDAFCFSHTASSVTLVY